MRRCYRCLVSGRVQGVFFRASTRRMAEEFQVGGYARNLPDNRVEVLMCGEQASVDALRNWLWTGPSAAQVEDVQCEPLALQEIDGFSTR